MYILGKLGFLFENALQMRIGFSVVLVLVLPVDCTHQINFCRATGIHTLVDLKSLENGKDERRSFLIRKYTTASFSRFAGPHREKHNLDHLQCCIEMDKFLKIKNQ